MRNKEYSWFMLANAPGFGIKAIHYIYETLLVNHLSVNDLFDMKTDHLKSMFPDIGRGKLSKSDFLSFESLDSDALFGEFEKLKDDGVQIIGLDNDLYPKTVFNSLKNNAPPVLYCKGYLPLLNQPGVAIAGARDVNELEVDKTKIIAQDLSKAGINVISGYAKGVDTAAHIGALEADGTTIMILSYGVNHISIKKQFNDLGWQKNSLFVTQFAPGDKFSGSNAMLRNKLVCAFADAMVIIKSGTEIDNNGKMSGTFNAGKIALNMGIPLFVLSSVYNTSLPQGNQDLINSGGIEFNNSDDIINFLKLDIPAGSLKHGKNGSHRMGHFQTKLF